MAKTSAIGTLSVTDLNDAIIAGTEPNNPTEGTLWLDTSKSPPILKIWKNNQWQNQPIDISSLDPDMATVIENITVTLGNMANDNVLDFKDRTVIVDNLMEIIGKIMSATDATMPTSSELDNGKKGNFYQVRKDALNAGVLSSSANYIGLATAYTALCTYLATMTPIKPWDISDKNKNLMITIVKSTFRQKWLDYYLAVQKLAEETSNKLKENMDDLGTDVSSVKAEISTLKDEINLRVTETELKDALTPYPTKTEVTSEIKVSTDGIKNTVSKEIEDKVSGAKTELKTLIEQTEDKIESTVSGISQSGGNLVPSANFADESQWSFGGTLGNGEFKFTDEMQLGGTKTLKMKTGATLTNSYSSTPYLPESALKLIGKKVTVSVYLYIPSGQGTAPSYFYANLCGYPNTSVTSNPLSIECKINTSDIVYDEWKRYYATGIVPKSNASGNVLYHKLLLGVDNTSIKSAGFIAYFAKPQVDVSDQLNPWNMGDTASQTQITQLSDKIIIDVNNAKEEAKDYADDKVAEVKPYERFTESLDFGDYDYSGNPNFMKNITSENWNKWITGISEPNPYVKIFDDYIIIDATDASANDVSRNVYIPNITRLQKGKKYTMSVTMMVDEEFDSGGTNSYGQSAIHYVIQSNGIPERPNIIRPNSSMVNQWQRVSVTFTVPSTALDGEFVFLHVYEGKSVTGKWYIKNDIKIEEGTEATPYQPNLLDAPYYLSKVPLGENIANKSVTFPIKTSAYAVYDYKNVDNFIVGEKYVLTIKATKPATQTFNVRNTPNYTFGVMKPVEGLTNIWVLEFTPTSIDAVRPSNLQIYQVPNDTKGAVQIDWLKIEKGDTRTPIEVDSYKYKGIGVKDTNNIKEYSWSDNPEYITKNTVTNDNYYKDKEDIFNEIGSKVDNIDFNNLIDFAEQLQESYEKFKSDEYLGDLQDIRDYVEGLIVDLGNKAVLFDFLNSYIKFTDQGILMEFNPPDSDETAKMSMLLTTDRLSFFDGGKEVAYFSNQAFFINRGAIVESMQVGSHKITKLNDDHTVFQFVGALNQPEGG